jgi:hypothetical protein
MSEIQPPIFVVAHNETYAKIHARNATLGVKFSADLVFRDRKEAELATIDFNRRMLTSSKTYESFVSQDEVYVWEIFFEAELARV